MNQPATNGASAAQIEELSAQLLESRVRYILTIQYFHFKFVNNHYNIYYYKFDTLILLYFQLTIEGLEKERDFYFSKLRDIEVIAQEYEAEGGELVTKTLNVLYQTEVIF